MLLFMQCLHSNWNSNKNPNEIDPNAPRGEKFSRHKLRPLFKIDAATYRKINNDLVLNCIVNKYGHIKVPLRNLSF